MDLKVVCLLFGCLLSIALAQDEEETEDRGSEDRGSEEGGFRCEGRGGPGWGGHGGKHGRGGRMMCYPMSLGFFKECKDFNKKLCESMDKEEIKKCFKMETFVEKHGCMVEHIKAARNSFGEEKFPDCSDAVLNFINSG